MEKDEAQRADFIETVDSYPLYKLYYVDECGIDSFLYREYGYAPRGEPVYGKISGKKFKRTNIVAAKNCGRLVAPMLYGGTTDAILFEHWFVHALLKTIPKYSVIVLDNASFHRKAMLRSMAGQASCEVLFLPPYSPDLNPIEKSWAWLKGKLRKLLLSFDSFDDAFMACFGFK